MLHGDNGVPERTAKLHPETISGRARAGPRGPRGRPWHAGVGTRICLGCSAEQCPASTAGSCAERVSSCARTAYVRLEVVPSPYLDSAVEPVVYVHPKDAGDRGLVHGEMVRVRSRRGEIELRLKVSHREALGSCFIPFHFREAAANLLTIDEIDPYGKIPEFKFCAVEIEPLRETSGRL